MSTTNHCPQCGAELAANAPQGLCPACLLHGALATDSAASGGGPSAVGSDFVPPTPEQLAPLFPDLEILELLGRGGMGVVYKARQKHLDRLVALKILVPKIARDPAFAERFSREARAMALLAHPHIVTVHDFGQKDGLYYFLMEFVDGLTLRQLLNAGRLTPPEALAIVPQICEALQYAHDKGVVHRDIKPENILMDRSGQVKIADFGLAKLVDREANDLTLTGAGQVLGTPHYMAPEQTERPQEVDHRADIYSLGVVFYQMLTGELPLGRFAPPSKKVQIDVRLDEVVLRALEKEPERRYQQASQLKTEVESIATSCATGSASASLGAAAPSLGATGSASASPLPSTGRASGTPGNGAIEQARRQVKGPAIGLLVTGIVNWAVAAPLGFVIARFNAAETGGPGKAALLAPILLVAASILILVAAHKMKRLQAHRLAVAASILAIIISPGNLIGLPIGIWALVVLSQREVRAAFGRRREGAGFAPETRGTKLVGLGWAMIGVAFLSVAAFSVFVALGRAARGTRSAPPLPAAGAQPPEHTAKQSLPAAAPEDAHIVRQITGEGWDYWRARQFAEAAADFREAIKLAPNDENAWNGLGWASFNSGAMPEAKDAFEHVIALNPNHPAALNGLGQLHLAQRQYDAAERYLLKAAPNAPAAWWGLTKLYLLQGKFAAAEKWAQKIVDSGDSSDDARRLLQAAKEKHLGEDLRKTIEPPPAKG